MIIKQKQVGSLEAGREGKEIHAEKTMVKTIQVIVASSRKTGGQIYIMITLLSMN